MTRTPPTVQWRDDGTPTSPRFGDIYRSAGLHGQGGLAQARHVFLSGCGLLAGHGTPARWQHARRWAVLELGFGLGLNFLATWHAWRTDAARPARLLYTAVDAFPPEAEDLLQSVAPFPDVQPLARQLAAQWHGLLPGIHRLRFDGERVALTLAVGDVRTTLPQLGGCHDSLFLDGFSPARNAPMWSATTLRAAARRLRRGSGVATWCVAASVRKRLQESGFVIERVPGLPPKRQALRGRFDPAWTLRRRHRSDHVVAVQPGRCIVVGAGVAGAAAAWSLAQRGWQVRVLDRAPEPCAGASGVPVGLVTPHVSADDCTLSQLTRAGVQATFSRAALLLRAGRDFAVSGVLERHAPGQRRLPPAWAGLAASAARRPLTLDAPHATTQRRASEAGLVLSARQPALWHAAAGWLRPAALVRAMLAAPAIAWQPGCPVLAVRPQGQAWQVMGPHGRVLAEAELVVIAAGLGSLSLLAQDGTALPLHALRGQVTTGPMPAAGDPACWPPFPINGQGHFLADLPGPDGPWWQAGSTFQRDSAQAQARPADDQRNQRTLAQLLPATAQALAPQWVEGHCTGWAGVRATLPNHLPAVGPWMPQAPTQWHTVTESEPWAQDGRLPLHLCTGMGARGLTLAVLCGDILAARLHDEPLPLADRLLQQLASNRYVKRTT